MTKPPDNLYFVAILRSKDGLVCMANYPLAFVRLLQESDIASYVRKADGVVLLYGMDVQLILEGLKENGWTVVFSETVTAKVA